MKKTLSIIILHFAVCILHSSAATYQAAGVSTAQVQAAVDLATHGDTVTIPNGSATWTAGISTTKRIIIRALNYTATPAGMAGSGATTRNVTIQNNSSSSSLFTLTTGNDYHCGLAGIAFVDVSDTSGSAPHFTINGTGSKVCLVNDLYLNNRSRYSPALQPVRWLAQGGVIWNTVIDCSSRSSPIGGIGNDLAAGSILVQSPRAWTTAATWGMADSDGTVNFYIEDSTFKMSGGNDLDVGGRLVTRYCLIDGQSSTSHGFTSGITGRHFEYYDCTFQVSAFPRNIAARWYWVRGGTGLFTDCVVNGDTTSGYGNPINIAIGERPDPSGSPPYTPSSLGGYPINQQPGFGHNGSSHVSDPIYLWNNTGSRAYTYAFYNSWGEAVLIGRDLFLNQGAKPGYVKFTYPHPARTGEAPPPDTTPPVISGTNVNSITSSSLVTHWETLLENTTNALDYGTSLAYGTTLIQGSYSSSFDQQLTGLATSTLYYLRIRSGDVAGNKSTNTLSATTAAVDSTAPTFTAGQTNIININSSGATIVGTVNELARSGATWGYTTVTSEGSSTNGAALSQTPSVVISGATPSTLVYIRFWVSDIAGNTNSVLASFTTQSASSPPGVKTYYVDQTAGNDNNSGLTNFPWKNCPGMRGTANFNGSVTLNPGDTIYFDRGDAWYVNSAGLFEGGFTLAGGVKYIGDAWGSGTKATIQANGRCEGGIVRFFEDHNAIETWIQGFIVDGASTNSANGIDVNHSFWNVGMTGAMKVITNNTVRNVFGNSALGDYRYSIIVSDNSPDASAWVANVLIVNNVVPGFNRVGIAGYPGSAGIISNIVVRGNYVTGPQTDPNYSDGHGIGFAGLVKDSIIEYNTVTNVEAAALFITSASGNGPTNLVARYNILQSPDDNGTIRFYGASGGTLEADIYGNLILSNTVSGGLNFDGVSGTAIARVFNNTFVNTFVAIGNPTTATIQFSNNIIHTTADTPFTDANTKVGSHGHNLFYRTGGGTTLASVGGSSYTSGTITGWESTAQTGDPLFSSISSLPVGFVSGVPTPTGLRILDTSPAENNGAAISTGSDTDDIEGNPRPYGMVWDIGAYEYSVFTISGVLIDQILSTSARISFELSQGGSAGITWGTTSATLDGASTNATASTSHSLNMTGMTPSTGQYVKIHAVASGVTNTTSNYQFTTGGAAATNIVAVPRPSIRVTPRNP